VPAYVLLAQSPMHFEPRFALPKDAFTPALVAVGLVGLAGAVARRARRYWM
jgi:MYXO-CTERM domain-containing protein